MILALAILSGSFLLIRKFFGSAEELKTSIDAQTESQIKGMLMGGDKVAIPMNRITARTGDFVTFGVGILNVLREVTDPSNPDRDVFFIEADDCEDRSTGATILAFPGTASQEAKVKKNDQKIFLVGYEIESNTRGGTYICNIRVLDVDGEPYAESVYKAYIKVE